jgi:hypothetical protein
MKTARYRTVVREFEHAERVMEKKHDVEGLRALLECTNNSTSTMNTSRACATLEAGADTI